MTRDMPQHPWNIFAQIDASWASMGRGSHNFRNINCCSKNKPATELVMTPFNDTLQVCAAAHHNLWTLVSLTSADTHVSHMVPACIFQMNRQDEKNHVQHLPSHPHVLVIKVLTIMPLALVQKIKEAVEISWELSKPR